MEYVYLVAMRYWYDGENKLLGIITEDYMNIHGMDAVKKEVETVFWEYHNNPELIANKHVVTWRQHGDIWLLDINDINNRQKFSSHFVSPFRISKELANKVNFASIYLG